ncbi:MAG: polyphosphate polymerase domain-containing protein [Paludibacteraceae bacterium]|nr:polyphosphate polymerase domain-containing protein [Paludibacteraceae bacterium]
MQRIDDILQQFAPITLQEMEAVKLMNRIDTKYVMPMSLLPQLLQLAQQDYFVQAINGKRTGDYDTVYYDTEDLEMYIRHHDRQLVRQKIRVREYVDSHLFFLEVKRKNNKGRTKKKRISIPSFTLTPDTVGQGKLTWRVDDFLAAKSWYHFEQITPRLRTAFTRITLVNTQKTERLTIDTALAFTNLRSCRMVTYPEMVIVELKRDGNVPSPMIGIMQQLRIKPLKISKYCIGTAMTTPEVKQNRFKLKIRKLAKLLNAEPVAASTHQHQNE